MADHLQSRNQLRDGGGALEIWCAVRRAVSAPFELVRVDGGRTYGGRSGRTRSRTETPHVLARPGTSGSTKRYRRAASRSRPSWRECPELSVSSGSQRPRAVLPDKKPPVL